METMSYFPQRAPYVHEGGKENFATHLFSFARKASEISGGSLIASGGQCVSELTEKSSGGIESIDKPSTDRIATPF